MLLFLMEALIYKKFRILNYYICNTDSLFLPSLLIHLKYINIFFEKNKSHKNLINPFVFFK